MALSWHRGPLGFLIHLQTTDNCGVSLLHKSSRLLLPHGRTFRRTAPTPLLPSRGLYWKCRSDEGRPALNRNKLFLLPPTPATASLLGLSLPASLLGGAGTEPGPRLRMPLCLRSPLAHDSATPGVSSQDTCCPQLRLHLALCHREDGAGRVYAGRLGSGMTSAAFLRAGLQEIWALLARARKLARLDMDQGLRVQVNSSCLPPAI